MCIEKGCGVLMHLGRIVALHLTERERGREREEEREGVREGVRERERDSVCVRE